MGVGVVMIVWYLDLQLHGKSVPISTKDMSSNHAHGEVYAIQHYVLKLVSDLRQVVGFIWFLPEIKLSATIQLKYY